MTQLDATKNAPKIQAFYFRDFKNAYIPHILQEIYIQQIYAPFLNCKFDTIIDVGANIGLTSHYFSSHARRVIAVEPSILHTECIKKTLESNDIDNVVIDQCALGSENGVTEFYHNINSTMFSLEKIVETPGATREQVKIKDLETLLNENNIDTVDLMKLDTEGHEGAIITSESWRENCSRIKIIVGEWHTWSSMTQNQFTSCLRDQGFSVYWLGNTAASIFVAQR